MATSVAVIGEGDSNRRNTNALLKDLVEGFAAEVTFVVPVTAPWFTDAVRHVADWVFEHQSTFVSLAFVADSHDIVDLSDYEDIPVTKVEDMLDALAESDQVIVSWSDGTDWLEIWVEGALKSGRTVLDLTDGLYPIEYTPDADEDTTVVVDDVPEPVVEPEPVTEPVAEKPKPRSRAARNAAKAQEAQVPLAKAPVAEVTKQGIVTVQGAPKQGKEVVSAEDLKVREEIAQRAAEIVLERLRSALG